MERVKQIASHFAGSRSGVDSLLEKRPDDVVITLAIRSPLCKGARLLTAASVIVL
jgi:acetyl-CoA acyltransferase 1